MTQLTEALRKILTSFPDLRRNLFAQPASKFILDDNFDPFTAVIKKFSASDVGRGVPDLFRKYSASLLIYGGARNSD